MTKFFAILTTLFILTVSQPSSACDNWPSCTFTETHKTEHVKSHKSQRNLKKHRTIRDIPVIGDVVGTFQSGMASFYWQPQKVACGGGRFNPEALTAAHKTLPCGTHVRVTNKRNGQSVVVTINDRGPYVAGRIIDLSLAAARAISMVSSGTAPVTLSRM